MLSSLAQIVCMEFPFLRLKHVKRTFTLILLLLKKWYKIQGNLKVTLALHNHYVTYPALTAPVTGKIGS